MSIDNNGRITQRSDSFLKAVKKSLAAVSATVIAFGGLASASLMGEDGEANAAGPENPYAASTITKMYDGTGQGTPDGTFINADNGYVPGDNTPTDGVVATNDYVGYEVETRFQAGPERTVVVSFNAPEYLKFTSATNPGICASNSFVTGTPVTSGNTITGCSYKVKRGVGVTVQHNLTATALDTKGEAIYDQVTSIGTGISGQGSYSSHNAEAVTVVSAPTADLVLRPSTCTVAGSCSSIGSSTSTGYLEVMVDALKWPGYNTDKGASTLGAWTAQLDVSDFPDGTVWSVDGITAPVSNGVLNLGPHSGSKQISFSVPEHWGLEEGQTKGFNAHLIVPDTAFETESYKNNGTGWEPGQGNPSGYSTYDDKSTGARRGYVYANNDWTRINVTRAKPVAGQIFFKGQERPWSSSQTLWEDGNKLFSAGTPTSVTSGSRYPTDAKYKYWDMVPGTEMLTKVGTYTNNIDFQQGDTSRTNVIISDEWDTNFVEADATRETYVTGPDGKRVTSRVRIQWSTTVKGASIAAQPPSDTGWVTSDKPMKGATSVRAVFDELPTGNSEGAGQYTLHVPTRIKTTLAEPEIPTTTSDTMRGSYAGATSGTISVPVSIITMGTPELGIAVEPSGTVIPADTNTIDYTITPTVDGLLSSTDLINGTITITLDPCINEYTLNSEQWEIVTEDMGLGCGDEGFNTIVLKLRDDWNPSLSFNGGKTTVPKISITAKWSKITDNPGFVSARWELDKIDGAQSEKLDDVVPVSGSATVTPIPVSVAGQMITTSTPKVEIGDTLKYQAIVEAAATGAGSVSANSTVVVMPGRGDDNAFRDLFDYFDGPESSEFHGTYTVSKVQIVTKDSVPGTTVQCTTDTNPSLDPSQGTWSECVGSRLANATAIKVNQAGGENQGISTVDIELMPIGNKTGDNYLMWIGAVTGADITAGYSLPANDEVVSSDISGYTYWDIAGKGFDYREGWPIQADITVQLLNESGAVIATTTSDEDGYYEFTELHSGEYQTRVPDIGATGGFPKTMPSAFYPDRVIDVSQTFSYRGQKLANASTTSSRIKLGIDATQANVNFGFTAPDPYSDLKKDAARVQCTGDEVVCNVSWDITVKNGGTPFEPGEILGATGTSPAANRGSGVWTTDGYYIVSSNGTATKANTTGTVLGATGTSPAASSGSGVWTTDGYYVVKSDGTATKAQTTGTVLGATGTGPAGSSYGSGVWTTDGYYIVQPNGTATKANIPLPEAPEFTGTPVTLTGGKLTDSTSKEVYDLEAIIGKRVVSVSAGDGHSLALASDGTVYAWGNGRWGQLGIGSTPETQPTPIQVKGVGGDGILDAIVQVSAGSNHSLALASDGTVYAWGRGINGQLGNGSQTQQSTPVQVKGVGGDGTLDKVVQISAGSNHSLALTSDSRVYAWGSGQFGQLGNGSMPDAQFTPVKVVGADGDQDLENVIQVSAGGYHSLAVTSDNRVYAWGWGSSGQLGNGLASQEGQSTPLQVKGVDGTGTLDRVMQVSAGSTHSLALGTDGGVYAWGSNNYGELGNGSTVAQDTPVKVKGVGGVGTLENIDQVSSGGNHSLALTSDGTVYAWGNGSSGKLGNGTVPDFQSTPVQVKGVGDFGQLTGVVQVSTGLTHSLAMGSNGSVYAWGSGVNGKLGDGSTTQQSTPVLSDFSFFDKVILATLSQTPNGDFITRDYQLPNLEPGEEVTVTLSGKVNRKSYESPVVGEGFVIGNQAWETFTQTPRNTPDLPRPSLPAYSKDTPYAYGKWTGNSTCTATPSWVTPGDQCDQVYAQVEPTSQRLGSLEGYLWVSGADEAAIPVWKSTPRVIGTPVTLYRGVNGEFQNVAGTTVTDASGYYKFENLVPGDNYYVSFAPVSNPDVALVGEAPAKLLGAGQSWVWSSYKVNTPTEYRPMTDGDGVTTPNVAVVANTTTQHVNGAIRVVDIAIEAVKGSEDGDGNLQQSITDRPWDETTEVKAYGRNTGTDDIHNLVFEDRNISGDYVAWESCTITGGDPASFDLTSLPDGEGWDEETDTFTATLPTTWVLKPGTDTLTCVGTLPALGSKATEDGYHKDEITYSGAGVITGLPVEDDSPFEVTTTPKVQPTPEIELEKGILMREATQASECEEGEVFAQDACWIKDYTAQVGQSIPITFKMTNNGEEPLLDMALDDLTTLGDFQVSGIACTYETKEVNGRVRSVLDVGKSATCTGTLVIEEIGQEHKNEAIVWAVGEESSTLVSDDSDFTARATSEPPTVTLPNSGGRSSLVFLVIGGFGALVAAVTYVVSRRRVEEL